jgi:hypothetical protein
MRAPIAALITLCLMAGGAAEQVWQRPESVNCARNDRYPDKFWEETEAHCLEVLKTIAVRKGDVLQLTLEDGSTRSFKDVTEGCEPTSFVFEKCYVFRLQAYSRIGNSFTVSASFMECGHYLVVDRRGGETLLDTMPVYSPLGTRFISVNASELCDRPYDVAIWSTDVSPPKREWEYAHANGGPYEVWEFLGWDGETTIRLRATVFDGKGGAQTYDTEAVHTAEGWRLARPWMAPR